jgi:hypothetical protein
MTKHYTPPPATGPHIALVAIACDARERLAVAVEAPLAVSRCRGLGASSALSACRHSPNPPRSSAEPSPVRELPDGGAPGTSGFCAQVFEDMRTRTTISDPSTPAASTIFTPAGARRAAATSA